MFALIKKYKSPSETILTSRKDVFFSLCKSIIGQQISVAAANSVFLKFKKKCKNKITAKIVNKLTTSQLKSCGLSRLKVKGIKSLAKQVIDKTFNPKLIPKMSDEEAIIYLSELRQIGRWSAESIINKENERLSGKVVTKLSQVKNYCAAEEYHQKYLEKR